MKTAATRDDVVTRRPAHEMSARERWRGHVAATLRHDVSASLTVFMVAIPLSLGIALASNAPLTSGQTGTAKLTYDPLRRSRRYRLRAAVGDVASPALTVQTRHITLAAFGDVNLGDGVGAVMDSRGALWPWRGVAPILRRADISFGNLECSISNRGVTSRRSCALRGLGRAQPRQQPRRRLRDARAA